MPSLYTKLSVAALALLAVSGVTTSAQSIAADPAPYLSRADVSLGYNFIHANAPPGGSEKFNMDGGFVSSSYAWRYWLGFAGEATVGHQNDIGPLGQDLTLTTVAAGPRVTAHQPRLSEYAQVLVGVAHGSNSYFPTATSYTTSASSFAFTLGGGLDWMLSHRYAVRLLELQYLHSSLPNGVNHSQNELMAGAGIVFRFGGHYATSTARAEVPPTPKKKVSMSALKR